MPRNHRPARAQVITILVVVALITAGLIYLTCTGPRPKVPDSMRNRSVTLYTSADDDVIRTVVDAFKKDTGLDVLVVTDTEATKTFGLVQRLIDERTNPRADVWWSSEPLGTIRLARERIIEPYNLSLTVAEGRPPEAVYGGGTWYALAQRARVIAYSTKRVAADQIPRTLRDLTDLKWKGRVGMARPQFGTTKAQIAALVAFAGPERTKAWLEGLKANDVRLYDGNSSVVRAIAHGEIDIGLTDTDDVWSAQRNNWDVALVYETPDTAPASGAVSAPAALGDKSLPSFGPLLLPNTVAKVRNAPTPKNAARLIEFLLSPRVEQMLAESGSHNIPVRTDLSKKCPDYAVPNPWTPDLEQVGAAANDAMTLCAQTLGN